MNRKHYILGTLALLCLLGTGYYAWTLYDEHRKQVAEWSEGAKAAFEEALWMEVNKRAEVPFNSSSIEEEGMITLKEKIPDTVFITSHLGRIGYRIECTRYDNSLIKETRKRAALSTLFSSHPLSVDTLDMCWNRLLLAKKILVNSKIRYIKTDLELRNDTVYSKVDNHLRFDSLTVSYLGFRCEHEVAAFVSYPYWLFSLSGGDYCILSFPWILFLLLIVFYSKLEALVKRTLMHEKVIEKEIIVEKEVYIADIQIDKADILNLPDGTSFDTFAKVLTRGEIKHNIQPQSASLLKLFLSKSDYKVTSEEISWELWQVKREKDRLYSAIRRLRNDLKNVKSDLTIFCSDGIYELKFPISSNISDQN